MTQIRHAHNTSCSVADAHGRNVDFMVTRPASTCTCPCTRPTEDPRPRGRPGAVVIRVAAILTAGLVAAVLLVVIRDVITTMASTGVTGLILRAFLTPSDRRDR
ncbi:hypothetical protein ACFY6U_50610 [Streptomyces sp. NPDC013157]|uniref:hypothetical protein n=1 Tax=Streptomyces sp. NPDC013157 TaxID=3364861 RepID=UPI0036B4F071